jgi:hypothetical protein
MEEKEDMEEGDISDAGMDLENKKGKRCRPTFCKIKVKRETGEKLKP